MRSCSVLFSLLGMEWKGWDGTETKKVGYATYVFEEAGEGEPLVSRKSPDLAARGGNTGDCRGHGQQDEDKSHKGSRGFRVRRLIQDLNDRDARLRRRGQTEDIILPVRTETEAKRDEHQQAQRHITNRPPHQRLRQHARGILQLLRHMRARVWPAEETPKRRRDSHEDRKPRIAPPAIIFKLRKDLLGRRVLARGPEHDDEDDEANDMHDHEDAFCQREVSGAEDIECRRGDEEEHDEERRLPQCVDFCVRVP